LLHVTVKSIKILKAALKWSYGYFMSLGNNKTHLGFM
jgi:hypothetical protein